jgi:predicted transcriptional regulator
MEIEFNLTPREKKLIKLLREEYLKRPIARESEMGQLRQQITLQNVEIHNLRQENYRLKNVNEKLQRTITAASVMLNPELLK